METLILYNNMTFLHFCVCQTIRFLQSGMFGHWIFYNFVFVDRGTYSTFWRVLNYCVWQFGKSNIPGSGSLAVCWSAAGVSVLPFDDMRASFLGYKIWQPVGAGVTQMWYQLCLFVTRSGEVNICAIGLGEGWAPEVFFM